MGPRLLTTFAALVVSAGPLAAAGGSECRCLYQGRYFEQGETVCIHVDGSERLAQCDMALNNSSWRFLAKSCPSASMTPLPPGVLALVNRQGISGSAAAR